MIIRYFNLLGSFVSPHKTHSELIVDPYAVLPSPIIFEGFQTIPWGMRRESRDMTAFN